MDNLKTTNKIKWLYPILIVIILLLAALVGYQGYSFYQQSKQPDLSTSKGICSQYNLKDDFQKSNLKNPMDYTKEESEKVDLFNILFTTNLVHLQLYQDSVINKSPYDKWQLVTPSLGERGSESYSENDITARSPYIGLFNLKLSEIKNITPKNFYQINLCSYKKIFDSSDEKVKQLFPKNDLNSNIINEAIIESQKQNQQENLENLANLDKVLKLNDTISANSPVNSKPVTIYDNFYLDLFNQLPLLIKDYEDFASSENKTEYIQNLYKQKATKDDQFLENETSRLKLGYENQADKMFNVSEDLFVILGQSNGNELFKNSGSVYLLARDLKNNNVIWFLPNYFIKDAVQSVDKKTIYALAYNKFDTQATTQDPGEILEIEPYYGTIKQKYNASGQFIQNISYIDKDNMFVSLKTDSNTAGKIVNLKGGKQIVNYEGLNIGKWSMFSPNIKYFAYIAEKNNEFSYPKKDYVLNLVDVVSNKIVLTKEFTHNGDLSNIGLAFDDKYLNLFYSKNQVISPDKNDPYGYKLMFYDNLKIDYKADLKITESTENSPVNLAKFSLQGDFGIADKSEKYAFFIRGNKDIVINKKNSSDSYDEIKTLILPQNLQGFDRGYAFNEDQSFVYFSSRYGEFHKFDYTKF